MIFVEKISSSILNIWTKKHDEPWICYDYRHLISSGQNYDAWCLYDVKMGYLPKDKPGGVSLLNPIEIYSAGAIMEYAIAVGSTTAFVGNSHGNDKIQTITFLLDGVAVPLTTMPTGTVLFGSLFEIRKVSILYSPVDSITKIANMFTRTKWNGGSLRNVWRCEWVSSAAVMAAYGSMFGALRGAKTTTVCRLLSDGLDYDVSTSSHSRPGANQRGVRLSNSSNNLVIEAWFNDMSFFNNFKNSSGAGIWISNDPSYNKIYPTRVYPAGQTENVSSGDRWNLDAEIRIQLAGGY